MPTANLASLLVVTPQVMDAGFLYEAFSFWLLVLSYWFLVFKLSALLPDCFFNQHTTEDSCLRQIV